MILRKRQTQGWYQCGCVYCVCYVCDGPSIMGQVGVQSQRWRLESGVLACQWTLETRNDIKIELCERWVEWISGDGPAHSTQSRGRGGGWWTAAGDWGLGNESLC